MRAVPHLEDYLRTAEVVHIGPLPGGGGHAHKQLVVLEGGLGAVAKLSSGPDQGTQDEAARQVPREVAAWRLARAIGKAEAPERFRGPLLDRLKKLDFIRIAK